MTCWQRGTGWKIKTKEEGIRKTMLGWMAGGLELKEENWLGDQD